MWFFAPSRALGLAYRASAREVHVAGDRSRTDEADRVNAGVFEELVHRARVAVHHVKDAVGQSRFLQEFREAHR